MRKIENMTKVHDTYVGFNKGGQDISVIDQGSVGKIYLQK